jgi:hypothetical protein
MAKFFRPNTRESAILSKIESSNEFFRKQSLKSIPEYAEPLANAISMKLVEEGLVEIKSKAALEEQITKCLNIASKAEDFDIDFKIAPFRQIATNPNIISLYLTAFIIEDLINHKDVVDIYGCDEDIYLCINTQVVKYLPEV